MTNSEKRSEIKEWIVQYGLNLDRFIVGAGRGATLSNGRYRYMHKAYSSEAALKAEFAIKYFSDPDFYIVWHVWGKRLDGSPIVREKYSLMHDAVPVNGESIAKKGMEFKTHRQEEVYVFNACQFQEWLQALN